MDCRVIGEPPGLAYGEPDDKLRDAVLRTAIPGNDEESTTLASDVLLHFSQKVGAQIFAVHRIGDVGGEEA